MSRSTALIRIRFPDDLVERLDRLAARLRIKHRRRIPRAALVRALVQLHMGALEEDRQQLNDALRNDPVRRGRERVARPAPRNRGAAS